MNKIFILLFLILSSSLFSQNKFKKIKTTKEKIIFINDSIQNYKLFRIDGDYGHSGFIDPKHTIKRFRQNWYNEFFVHYINNERNFDERGNLINEFWFNKKDSIVKQYEYQYNDIDSLVRIEEKGEYYNGITNISYNYEKNKQSTLKSDENSGHFSLILNSYNEKGKINKIENIGEGGYSNGEFYTYNKYDLIDKVIIHKPTVWSIFNKERNSYYEKRDSTGTYYTSIMNYYKNGNIYEKHTYSPPDVSSPISNLYKKDYFVYDLKKRVIEHVTKHVHSELTYILKFKYDKKNKLIFESREIRNQDVLWDLLNTSFKKYYTYKKDEIVSLIIKTTTKSTNIEFSYKYDAFGNWIEQTKSINGKKLFIWKREIIYYNH